MKELEQHTTDTDDGYRLVLQRLNGGNKGPVIMCHGLAGNSYEYLLSEDDGNSLARYLASGGYDAWVVDLRGHGKSKGYFLKEENEWDYTQKAKGYWDFYVDDLIQQDTPAIINKVKEITGSSKVSWIGRSMGGWLAYAHVIDGHGSKDFKGVISVASPSHFSHSIMKNMGRSSRMKKFLKATHFDHLPSAPFQYTGDQNRAKMLNIMSKESKYIFLDFLDYVGRGEISRHDYGMEGNMEHYGSEKPPSYWEMFDRIDVPMVFITGTRDLFATPENTTESYNKAREAHGGAKLHILSGFGHINIIVGKKAYDRVYPLILDGLDGFED